MLWTPSSSHSFYVDNWGTNPSATPGTSVVPGASNVEGSWTQVLAALAQEVVGLYVRVSDGTVSGNAKNHFLDIGVDPAGGTTYTEIIANIVCGGSAAITQPGSGHEFFFPIRIPAGATVAVRVQGSNSSAGTVRVGVKAYGQPAAPHLLPVGQYSETLGAGGSTLGTSFTPGNAADGTWVSLGTTTRHLWWWQLAYQINDPSSSVQYTYIELGLGDGSNKKTIQRVMLGGTSTEAAGTPIEPRLLWHEGYWPTPAGSELWVRGRCHTTPDSGYNAVAVGIGG